MLFSMNVFVCGCVDAKQSQRNDCKRELDYVSVFVGGSPRGGGAFGIGLIGTICSYSVSYLYQKKIRTRILLLLVIAWS